MGSIPPELSLDLRPSFIPKSIGDFLKEISPIGDGSQKAEKLGDFIKRLEEEMGKIDAFKRELPLCMLLLKDGPFGFPLSSSPSPITFPKIDPGIDFTFSSDFVYWVFLCFFFFTFCIVKQYRPV